MEHDLSVRPVGICHLCARFRPSPDGASVCEAFPGGIPDLVRFGEVDHRLPVPGDGGLRFVALDELP